MSTLSTIAYSGPAADPSSERERLILEHLPQVRWVATRIHEKLPDSTSLEDLISIGIVGLINAIDNFDPQFNVKLKTYAEHKIRGAILDSLRGLDGVPAHKRKRVKQIQATIGALEQRLQRVPTEEEIAAELGISLQAYQDSLLELRAVSLGSLDAAPRREDSRSLIHFIAEPEENSPARILERSELEKLIAEGVKKMPRVEGLVLDLYYRQELGIREIAPILNLHITRVSQIKAQAILRLRSYLQRHWPTSKGTY
ncbi:MAG: polymerase, sigma 28 subunit, FliA/WhiG family [Bryobacterales bacterium]|jgi:RNA polymerase sigma factor for flagellar operon FliA|nr:polymerase, sigma 28 subunit, FliA/WhiG family [Bryobacterales bacterium]